MTQYVINIGALPNDGTGDPLRTAFNETNLNFDQVFAAGPVLSNIRIANNTILTTNTNGNLVLAPNGVGVIQSNQHIIPSIANVRNLGSLDRRWNTLYTQYANIVTAQITNANIDNLGNLTIPVANLHILGGTNGYVLQTDGAGNLTWTAQTGGSGNGTPGGANTQIQFNDAGSFGGSPNLTYNQANNVLTVNGTMTALNTTIYGNMAAINGNFSGDLNANNVTLSTLYSPNFYGNAIIYANSTGYLTNTNLFKYDPGNQTLTVGSVSTTGNVSATYFIGDGSQLTNLPIGTIGNILFLANTATSNSQVDLAGIGIGANGAVADFLYSGSDNLWETSAGLLINSADGNAWLISNDSITAPSGASWYSNSTSLDEYINSAPGGYLDISSLHANSEVASYVHLEQTQIQISVGPSVWTLNESGNLTLPGNTFAVNYANGTPVNISGGGGGGYGNANVDAHLAGTAGNIIPVGNNVQSLGNATNQWSDLWVSNNTIYINSVPLTLTADNVLTIGGNAILSNDSNTNISTTGTVTANSFGTTANLYIGPDANLIALGDHSQIKQFGSIDTLQVGWTDQEAGSPSAGQQAYIDFNASVNGIRFITGNENSTTFTTTIDADGNMSTANSVTVNGSISANGSVTGNSFAYANGDPLLGGFTIDNTTLRLTDADQTMILQSNATGGIIKNQLALDSVNGSSTLSAYGDQQTVSFSTSDWSTGEWTGTNVNFTGAANITNFVETGTWNSAAHRYLRINGGNLVVYTGASYGGGSITFQNVPLPVDDPTTVTTFELLYQSQSFVTIDYDSEEELAIQTQSLDIALRSTDSVNVFADQQIQLEGNTGVSISSLSESPVTITANVNGSSPQWVFAPTGNLEIPGTVTSSSSIDIASTNSVTMAAGNAVTLISNATGTVRNWTFDDTGNIILPGNTFAVKYANLEPVSLASAVLGNLEISGTELSAQASASQDKVEISGTAMGWAYLQLPTDGNANVLNTRLHNDAGNVEIGTGTLSTGPGIFRWTFDQTGNLNLPRSAVLYEKNSPTGLGNTVAIRPSRNDGDANQELLIYPTAGEGNHLHLTTGNLYQTMMYVGSDDFYVRLNTEGNIQLQTGNVPQNWSFNPDATTSFPNDVLQGPDGNPLSIYATANLQADVAGIELNPNLMTAELAVFKDDENKLIQLHASWGAGNTGRINLDVADSHWTFDESGNLTLPGNTFAVNYANGTQVSLGGGGGGSYGDSNVASFLAGYGSNTISTSGNITAGNFLGSGSNVDIVSGVYTWAFDTTGNLTLPRGSVITEVPSPIPGNYALSLSGTGITDPDQQLLVYPTSLDANHLHLTSGNLYSTELFLGNDNLYVKLANTGNVVVNTDDLVGNTAQWTFGTNGTLTFPNGDAAIVPDLSGTTAFQGAANTGVGMTSSGNTGSVVMSWVDQPEDLANARTASMTLNIAGSANAQIQVTDLGANVINNWTFDNTGNLTAPGVITANTFVSNAYNVLTAGNLQITSQYGLGVTGTILEQDGTLELLANGSGGCVVVGWDSSYGNGLGNIAAVRFNQVGGGEGNVVVCTGNRAGTEYNWNFDNTGNLTIPGTMIVTGGIVGSGASPAPTLSGFDSLSAITITATGTGTAINAASGNILTNKVTGTQFAFLNGLYTATLTGSGATSNYTLNLPANAGSNGQVLTTDGSGNLSWTTAAGGSYGNANVATFLAAYGSNTISTTGTIRSGNILSNGYARLSGTFDESQASTAGLYLGYAGGTPRIMFGTGNTNQTLEIDNDGGILRFYKPGTTLASLTNTGAFSVAGNVTGANLTTAGNVAITANAGQINFNTGAYISGNGAPISREGSIVLSPYTGAGSTFPGVVIGGAGRLLSPGGSVHQIFNSGDLTTQVVSKITVGTAATSTTTGALQVTGGAGITGNIYAGGTATTGVSALVAGATNTLLSNTVAGFTGNVNNYTQVTFQNLNTGADATADFILTANNGNDTVNYSDFGIINSGYDNTTPTNSLGNIVFAADTYLYAQGNVSNVNQSGGNLAVGTTVPGKTVKIFAGGVTSSSIIANISNTGMSVNGNVTASNFVGNISITGNVTGTSPNVTLVAGSYSWTFDNTGYLTLPRIGGDEGGQIFFANAASNSTITGPVSVDIYRNQIRFFESSANALGAYIDLANCAAGVGTLLNNRQSGLVNAGTFVTMDLLKATVTTTGNRGLSLAATTGSFSVLIGGTFAITSSSASGGSAGSGTINTTPSTSQFGWNFTGAGDISTYIITDTTNNRAYRVTLQIGASYNNNLITIERLV